MKIVAVFKEDVEIRSIKSRVDSYYGFKAFYCSCLLSMLPLAVRVSNELDRGFKVSRGLGWMDPGSGEEYCCEGAFWSIWRYFYSVAPIRVAGFTVLVVCPSWVIARNTGKEVEEIEAAADDGCVVLKASASGSVRLVTKPRIFEVK